MLMTDAAPTSAARANKKLILRGLYPATITPFNADYSVDYAALESHLAETCAAPGVSLATVPAPW